MANRSSFKNVMSTLRELKQRRAKDVERARIEQLEARRLLTVTGATITSPDAGSAIEGSEVHFTFTCSTDEIMQSWTVKFSDATSSPVTVTLPYVPSLTHFTMVHDFADETSTAKVTATAYDKAVSHGGAITSDTATYNLAVGDGVLSPSGGPITITGSENSPVRVIQSFIDPGGGGEDVSGTVAWGSGGTGGSGATVHGTTVTASNTYAEEGTYTGHFNLTDAGGSSTSLPTFKIIIPPDPNPQKPSPESCPAPTTNGANPTANPSQQNQGVQANTDPAISVGVLGPSSGGFGGNNFDHMPMYGPGPRLKRKAINGLDGVWDAGAISYTRWASTTGQQLLAGDGDQDAGDLLLEPDAAYLPNNIKLMPHLIYMNGGNLIGVSCGKDALFFKKTGSTYTEVYNYGDTLVAGGGGSYTFTSFDGYQVNLYGPTSGNVSGMPSSSTDAYGNTTTYINDGTKITEIIESSTSGTVTTKQSYLFGYTSSLLSSITLRRKVWDTSLGQSEGSVSYVTVQSVAYTYYSTGDSGGNTGDLKTATLQDASGSTIEVSYYRYWTGTTSVGGVTQPADALKYYLSGPSYARAAAALPSGTTVATATDAQLAAYADAYVEYNGVGEQTKFVQQGQGCSSCSGGQGTFTYSYSTNPSDTGDVNSWYQKVTVTKPDSTVVTHYYDSIGLEMLSVINDGAGHLLGTFTEYDANGNPILMAQPSAVNIPSLGIIEGYNDLMHFSAGSYAYLNSSTGLISTTTYYSSTTATSAVAGGATGYISDTYVQDGQSGTPIHQEHINYFAFTAGSTTIYPVATDTTYGDTAATDARVSSYRYTMYSSSTQIQSTIVGLPAVTSSQNGSDVNSTASSAGSTTTLVDTALGSGSYVGDLLTILSGTDAGQSAVVTAYNSSTHTLTFSPAFASSTGTTSVYSVTANVTSTYNDTYGRPIWTKDADGHVNYTAYDPATGAVTQSIVDVNYSSLTSAQQSSFGNTGWSNPSGLNLSTTYVVDAMGRSTKVTSPNGNVTYMVYNDAGHEMRVYPGFVSGATTGPIQIYRTYYPAANSSDFLYNEMITSSATPHLTSSVPDGTETISSSNIQSLERDFSNAGGQTVWTDRYVSLSGITYSQAVGADMSGNPSDLGTSGTNFYRTTFGFDEAGRLNQTVKPTGTIYRIVYDAVGRVTSRWVGTSDTHSGSDWTPSTNTGNMMDVEDDVYDSGGGGDSNLTQATFHVDTSSSDDRVSRFLYDFEDRLVAEKDGIQSSESDGTNRPITYYVLDNQGETVRTYRYAGDGVSLTDFSTAAVTDAIPTADASDIRALTVDSYDDEGRVYRSQTFEIDQTNGTNGLSDSAILALTNIATDTFYDHRGNTMAVFAPGGVATKNVYDGAGRLTTQYITDGGAVNNSNTPQKDWTHASSVSNDIVLTETDYTFDSDGNVILTIDRERFNNDSTSSTGALGSPSSGIGARVYYTAIYYDAADRLTDGVNVGTNGGSSYTRPGSVPSRSDTVLVTHTDYDVAGNAYKTTDPRGIVTQDSFDLLGRKTQEIDGASGSPATGEQLTNWTYEGDNNVLTMQAVFPGTSTPSQTTQYVYGVGTTSGTDLFSNDLIAKVEYPDKTTGNASTSASNDVSYTYDLLGEAKTLTDQNGNVHTYTYDVLGRVKLDAVTSLGSGVDGSIRALGYSYTALGLPYQQTSYSNSAGTTVVNQVQDVYNGFGQLITQYQEHSGSLNTSTSIKVQYGYTVAANGSRLTSMTYPNGRVEDYVYASGLSSDISRVSGIQDDSGTGTGNVQSYVYLGLSTIVVESDGNGIALTYIKQTGESNGDAGDQYIGLDRFGRVVDQRYIIVGSPSSPTDRFQYGYDRDSNVLYKNNLVNSTFSGLYHANSSASGDNNTAYDNVNELLAFRRGTLSSSSNNGSTLDTVSTLNTNTNSSQSYTLDAVGNQTSVTTDGTAQTNTVNSQNEETAAGSNSLAFDNNGNTTTDDQGHTLVYDAWNRLVTVKNGGTTIASYVYDANANRTSRSAGGTTTDYYSSRVGQVLEERQSSIVTDQNVWSIAYVNELVLRDDNSTSGSYGKSSSGLGRRIYVQHDAGYNVTALTDTSGNVLQRFDYTPYGVMTVIGSTTAWSTTTDGYSWNYTFQGGRLDTVAGLIHFGARDYSPTLARWVQRDPLTYIDGANPYQLEDSEPVNAVDYFGLVGAANHHGYPKYLGGAQNQPLVPLTKPNHAAAHKFLKDKGFGGPGTTCKAENDLARQKWAALSQAEQRQLIADSLRAADVSEDWIATNLDEIMASATPGVVQKAGSKILPAGVIGGAVLILLTSENTADAATTNSASEINHQLRATIDQLTKSDCPCRGQILSDLLSAVNSSVKPTQVYVGRTAPLWGYFVVGLLNDAVFGKDQWVTKNLPDLDAVAQATKDAQDAMANCQKCAKK